MANLLSLLRLLLAGPLVLALVRGTPAAGALGATLFCVAIASDLADGPIARARGTAGALGRALDHSADFAFVDSGLCAAALRGLVPWPLPLLVALAFLQYVADSYWLRRAGELRMSGLGRWNGVLYFAPLAGALLVQLGAGALAAPTAWLGWALAASTLASMADRAFSLRREAEGGA
ncbi:MAG TPA: CDP-alcohol phosphatidyltransferase family protein [Myxococcota bacterium]|nr:CDP-alcohol phosphatidyltransferase family protein [Myxococcota bacterium]